MKSLNLEEIDGMLKSLNDEAVRIQEEIAILTRLRSLRSGGTDASSVSYTKTAPTERRRGRPAKSEGTNEGASSKTLPLPKLLVHLANEAKKPLTFAEIASMVEQSGYQTDAKNPSNMVYQCLRKLTIKGVFAKDENDQFKLSTNDAA